MRCFLSTQHPGALRLSCAPQLLLMDIDDASTAKLASFLALAKGARGRAACAVIADATAAPGIFTFGELLDVGHIQEVRDSPLLTSLTSVRVPLTKGLTPWWELVTQLGGTEHASALSFLRVFAFGTLADYTGTVSRSVPGTTSLMPRADSPSTTLLGDSFCGVATATVATAAAETAPADCRVTR